MSPGHHYATGKAMKEPKAADVPTDERQHNTTEAHARALPYGTPLLSALAAIINNANSPELHAQLVQRAGIEVDPPSAFLIRLLGFRGPLRPSQLAAELGTGRSNISKMLARLRATGLVATQPDPGDARASRVILTNEGVQVARAAFHVGDVWLAEVTAEWPAEDLDTLTGLVVRLSSDIVSWQDPTA